MVAIYGRAEVLAELPNMGQGRRGLSNPRLRVLLWGHYRIVYLPVDDGTVQIVGVFHGATELKRHFR